MSNQSKIDFLDIKILDTLHQNARITKTSLSEKIGLSATPCHIRLKKLEELGLITGYYADIDYTALGGYSFYWVQIGIKSYSKEQVAKFEDTIQAMPEILECIATLGKVDYLLKVAAMTVQSYQGIIDGLLATEGLDLDYMTLPMVKQVKTPQQSSLVGDQVQVYREKYT